MSALPDNLQRIVDRFTEACSEDGRCLAAFLGGSFARDDADEYSDLDLGLVTTDASHADFKDWREPFVRRLGKPSFLEDFGSSTHLFVILNDGTEVDLAIGRESDFNHIQDGPYRVLLDKRGILAGAVFTGRRPTPDQQVESLRQQVYWFWHEMGHFVKAIARNELHWAQGQLGALRAHCIGLARLSLDFTDGYAGDEPYFKIEHAVPAEMLAPLQPTYTPMEREAMIRAAIVLVGYHAQLAGPLVRTHGITYPDDLAEAFGERLQHLSRTHAAS